MSRGSSHDNNSDLLHNKSESHKPWTLNSERSSLPLSAKHYLYTPINCPLKHGTMKPKPRSLTAIEPYWAYLDPMFLYLKPQILKPQNQTKRKLKSSGPRSFLSQTYLDICILHWSEKLRIYSFYHWPIKPWTVALKHRRPIRWRSWTSIRTPQERP